MELSYSPWRHGGWYTNVRTATGASGCVSRNYPDKKWRIVCDPRPFEEQPTFRTRDEAAMAEHEMAQAALAAIAAARLLVTTAYGSWAPWVMEGKVGVIACIGGHEGRRQQLGPDRAFYVDAAEYAARTDPFEVDPARHVELPIAVTLTDEERAA